MVYNGNSQNAVFKGGSMHLRDYQINQDGFSSPIGWEIFRLLKEWHIEGREEFEGQTLGPDNESEWQRLVSAYFCNHVNRCISVNASNLCPSLNIVDEITSMVQDYLAKDISFMCRHDLADASQKWGQESICKWLGISLSNGSPEGFVTLTRNATEANNIINNGLAIDGVFDPLKHNVVTWEANHPTNFDAWYYRKETQKWHTDAVKVIGMDLFSQTATGETSIPTDPPNNSVILDAFKNAIDKNTRIVSVSWQSNETGMLLPMKEIVELVRKLEDDFGTCIHIHADCAQTFGLLQLQLTDMDVDSVSGSFHKWPCGPKMVGVLYMKDADAAKRFVANTWGYDAYIQTPTGYFSHDPTVPIIDDNAKRFSYLGQQNDATLVASWITALFHTGMFHPAVTPEVIENRVRYLGDHAQKRLLKELPQTFEYYQAAPWNWMLTPITDKSLRTSVLLFAPPPGICAPDVTKHVYDTHKFAIANLDIKNNQVLRISPSFNNTIDDVDKVIDAIIDIMSRLNANQLTHKVHHRTYA